MGEAARNRVKKGFEDLQKVNKLKIDGSVMTSCLSDRMLIDLLI